MKLQTPTMIDGEWIKKGEDVVNNDLIKILDEGRVRQNDKFTDKQGNPKTELVFKVETKNGTKNVAFAYNPQTGYRHQSLESLAYSFGDDTRRWIGQDVKVFLTPTPMGSMLYLCHKDTEKIEKPDGTIEFTKIEDNAVKNSDLPEVTETPDEVPLPEDPHRDFDADEVPKEDNPFENDKAVKNF